jgi:hypothetical protein
MKRQRVLLSLFVALFAFVAGSCSSDQSPTGVAATSEVVAVDSGLNASLLGGLLRPLGLLKCEPLPARTTTKTIGRDGGVIAVGPHFLWIPPGALDHDVTITAKVIADDVNSVEFTPHGLEFDNAAWLTMSYANCDLLGRLLPKRIAYTDNLLNILYYLLSFDSIWTKTVTGKVDHFSKYAVAW